VLALLAGAVLIAAVGQSPFEVYGMLVQQALGTGYGVGQTLFKCTPLLFAGLSVALAFRAGLFNVGAEGQMYLGGFAAALVGRYVPLPMPWLLPLALLAAASPGALWARDRRRAQGPLRRARGDQHHHAQLHRVRAGGVVGHALFMPATVRTREVHAAAQIARSTCCCRGSRLAGQPLARARAAAGGGARRVPVPHARGLRAARAGPEPRAAEYAGVRIGRAQVFAFALAGALAGLGRHELRAGLQALVRAGLHPAGAGFMGIAVALIGRNHPLGVCLSALFFGALAYGGLVGQPTRARRIS
jgi:simple sugar transport system permease protein